MVAKKRDSTISSSPSIRLTQWDLRLCAMSGGIFKKKPLTPNRLTQCGTGPDWLVLVRINFIWYVGICGVYLDLIHFKIVASLIIYNTNTICQYFLDSWWANYWFWSIFRICNLYNLINDSWRLFLWLYQGEDFFQNGRHNVITNEIIILWTQLWQYNDIYSNFWAISIFAINVVIPTICVIQ